jgi:TonB-linked SusC/RagA family outer membrane protein
MRKSIVLFMFLSCLITTFAQERIISGVVKDDTGEVLPGASFKIEGKNKGGITDTNGKFSISASVNDVLVLSFIGYQNQKLKVDNKSEFKIQMHSDTKLLEDVVVIGYGSQKRSDISTAVSSLNVNELSKSGSGQVLEAMQGKVSGVQIISNDGSPAGGLTFRIRGTNSLTGGTQPLFVIDGVPQAISTNQQTQATTNPLSFLNMNDIESMEILKDAAAAAIYGADGSNGVVLITTKKGKAGKAKFNFDTKFGYDQVPASLVETLSPKEYAEMQIFRASLGMKTDVVKWQDILDTQKYNDKAYAHDWMDEITQTAFRKDLNASMSGGSDTQNYMLSIGYLDTDGLLRKSGYNRFSTRLNLTQKVGKKISLNANLSYSNTKESNPITDWSQSGVFLKAMTTNPFLGYVAADNTESQDYLSLSPTVYVDERDLKKSSDDLSGKINIEYNIIKGLTFNTSYSLQKRLNKYTSYWGPNTWFGKSEHGRVEFSYGDNLNWIFESRLNYIKTIKKHSFGAMLAYEAKKYQENNFYSKTTNFDDTSLGIYGVTGGVVPFAPTYDYGDNSTLSLIGRGNYSFDDRYLVTASLRRDGSSRFGKNNQYAYFPAVSFAWRAKEESFLKDVDWVSNLKTRVSYGVTGNNQFPSYQSLSTLYSSKAVFDNSTIELAKVSGNIANDELKWESSKQYNVGLDFSVLKNRLNLTADYYYKRIDDMLMEVNLPTTSGYDKCWKNAGSMENKGFEFALNAIILNGPFRWTSDFNISFNKNKVLKLDENQYARYFTRDFSNDVLLRVGMPVGTYYGYIKDGIYNSQQEIFNSPVDPTAKLGSSKFEDVNKDGVIDNNDRTVIANTNPIHTGGWGNTFSFKRFELYAFLRWSYGNDEINANMTSLTSMIGSGSPNILKSNYYNAWTTVNPTNNGNGFVYNDPAQRNMTSEAVEDGSYLRLATLSLSYSFSPKIISKLNLSNLKITATGSNLWLLTRYSGFDPEANTGWGTVARLSPGYDKSPYPRPRSFMLALQIGL